MVASFVMLLLLVLAIMGIGKARQLGKRTQEIAAAHGLIAAFHTYSDDHDGVFFNGNNNKEDAYNLNGTKLGHMPPVATRYPWRLLPYLQGSLEGTLLVNESIEEARDKSNPVRYSDYSVSLLPSLAMNITYVGASRYVKNSKGEILGENPYTTDRLNQVIDPSKLIVFVSGGAYSNESVLDVLSSSTSNNKRVFHGYWYARAPYDSLSGSRWGQIDPKVPIMGNVHFRWDGRVVVAHLDGNVKLMEEKELRDMRRWANAAQQANDPDWAP